MPSQHDLSPYLSALRMDGILVLVGLLGPIEPPIHGGLILLGRKRIAGSVIGSIVDTQEMLDFCAVHGITCNIETVDIQDINTAYERMLKSDVRYRFVIDLASLRRR